MNNDNVVQKIWNLCNVLRGDGISYREYISELSYLLFLKIAEETGTENLLPKGYRWGDLLAYKANTDLLEYYQEMLTHLGAKAKSKLVRQIYAFPTTVFSHSENLRVVIEGIAKIDWHSLSTDAVGDIYEGLLSKNSEDARSGAGQYFTPRSLVDCIVKLVRPSLGDLIQDPAVGTGGFLISADHFIRSSVSVAEYNENPPIYQGMEIERGTYRLCLMNSFLHRMKAEITLGDALTDDAVVLNNASIILANPPFGSKVGGARKSRSDIRFPTANKQLEFLQHIYTNLDVAGRAAVVLPDNVLFEETTGKRIRQELMDTCNLHTILKLPTGIFYSPGVKTNVLFFSKGVSSKANTKDVWIYDMRTNMPQFGKRTPLTVNHFSEFIRCFGTDPYGKTKRKEEERFKAFSRDQIQSADDSLNFTWLKDEKNYNQEILSEPDEMAAGLITEFESIIADLNSILDVINTEEPI